MASAYFQKNAQRANRWHPFGAHGVLLGFPISLALWALIVMPFM